MKRFSKKRESILSCLRQTDTHPDAEWIYAQLKNDYPAISLGTVYRNLGEMKADGTIVSVGVVNDKERFDGRTDPHCHVICRRCGKVIDMDAVPVPSGLTDEAQRHTDFAICYATLQFVGLCAECQEKDGDDR